MRSLLTCLFSLTFAVGVAQDSSLYFHSVGLGATISHGGVSTELGWQMRTTHFAFDLGLKLDVSEINPPVEGPWGIYNAVSYSFYPEKDLQPILRMDQRLAFLEQRCEDCQGTNIEYELLGGYGVRWHFSKAWFVEHTIGMGLLYEKLSSEVGGSVYEQKGSRFNSMSRLTLFRQF